MKGQVHIHSFNETENPLGRIEAEIEKLKDELAQIIGQYEDKGQEETADLLTEALDALEDAYDGIWDVLAEKEE